MQKREIPFRSSLPQPNPITLLKTKPTALHHRVHVLSDVWFPQDTTPITEAHQFSLGFNLSYFFCKLPTRVFV